jgi:hypothetical protein
MEVMAFISSSRLFVATATLASSLTTAAFAGPLQQAAVNKIVNDVRVIDLGNASSRPAKLQDTIKDDLGIRTGAASRAELLFQDDTLTRLGAETLFSFKAGTRDLTLDRGTMLLQVPKGLGGAKIRTAAVTAAITGTTIMIENIPGSHAKVVVLEGSLRLSMNNRLGESVMLTPGKMIIVGPKDTRMPKPVSVDLQKLVKTSALIDPEKFRGNSKTKVKALPSIGLIEKEIATQTGAKSKARLAETNLVIEGDGTQVTVASKEKMAALESKTGVGRKATLLALDTRASVTAADSASANTRAGTTPASEKPQAGEKPEPNTSGKVTPTKPVEKPGNSPGKGNNPGPGNGNGAGNGDGEGAPGDGGGKGGPDDGKGGPGAGDGDGDGGPGKGSGGGADNGGGKGNDGGGHWDGEWDWRWDRDDDSHGGDGRVGPFVNAPSEPVTGTFSVAAGQKFQAKRDITATAVDLTPITDEIKVDGTVTAESLTFSAGKKAEFKGVVRSRTIDGSGGEIKFEQPIGAFTVRLAATSSLEVSSLLASDSISLSAPSLRVKSGIDGRGRAGTALLAPGAGASISVFSNSLKLESVTIANGGAALATSLDQGGDGGAIALGSSITPLGGDVELGRPISATTGANGATVVTGGRGGSVSVAANGEIKVSSLIKVSESAAGRASKQGGNIRLESRKTSGPAIKIENSGQLLSLLNSAAPGPGGKVEFVSAGGEISVDGATIHAEKGTVDMRNDGAGNITLKNAKIRADVVKANVLGANGQLIVGGGTIDADSAIQLYASGSNGSVLFNDDVKLNGNSVKSIAGNTVTVSNGKTVRVNGPAPATVYTNNANYSGSGGNGSTSGTFSGRGATTQGFANRPK